jgi:23S rRNA G2445 N2-methylase RlmL
MVSKAGDNLRFAGLLGPETDARTLLTLFSHDASTRFSATTAHVNVILANPPWGRKIGEIEDAGRILSNLFAHFSSASDGTTFGLVCPELDHSVVATHGLSVVYYVPLGKASAVWILQNKWTE